MTNENSEQDKLEKIEDHHRVNKIFLGPLERPAIAWLVKKMPAWVTPDHLTFFGLAASMLTGVSYYLTNFNKNYLWLAGAGFILNWFGDSLDGNLARFRKIERPKYGFFIDHTMDTISEVIIFIGIGLSPYVDLNLALLALVGYLCMANLVYITTSVQGEFKISYGYLGPTEARVIAIGANTIVYFMENPQLFFLGFSISLYNLVVIVITFLLFFFFVSTVIKEGINYDRRDRKMMAQKQKKDQTEQSDPTTTRIK